MQKQHFLSSSQAVIPSPFHVMIHVENDNIWYAHWYGNLVFGNIWYGNMVLPAEGNG